MDGPTPLSPVDDERTLRAAELSLGLVTDGTLAATLRRDPDLAREVVRWEDDFARFSEELEPVPPSPQAWEALQAAYALDSSSLNFGLVAANTSHPWWRQLFESLALWRGMTVAGFSTAALALVLLLRAPDVGPSSLGAPGPQTARALLVSSILPRDGSPVYVATYDPIRATILLVPAATGPATNQVPQLWLVPNDTSTPVALGALDPEQPQAISIASEHAQQIDLQAGLVITLEPPGAVIGPARGPVIAHGRFTKL